MKTIIVYYSKSGKTEKLAHKIMNITNSDLLKIEPEKEFGNYFSSVLRVVKENITGKKTEFITEVPDLSDYDIIFVGFPIWYNTIPSFVKGFLNSCNLNGKTLIPFTTASIATIEKSLKDIELIADGAEIFKPYYENIKSKNNFDKWISEVKMRLQ